MHLCKPPSRTASARGRNSAFMATVSGLVFPEQPWPVEETGRTSASAATASRSSHHRPRASVMKVPGIGIRFHRAARSTTRIANANPAHAPRNPYFTLMYYRPGRPKENCPQSAFQYRDDFLLPWLECAGAGAAVSRARLRSIRGRKFHADLRAAPPHYSSVVSGIAL
jgi:hypothetical protein